MAWAMLQEAVQKALHYSTPLGYIWMFLLFTFRMFITAVVGSSVYGDESSNFKCDTNQPGCQNVCFNRFSPISHMRFWAFQMMFVCLPSLCFMTYAQFEVNKIKVVDAKMETYRKDAVDDASIYTSADYVKMHDKSKKLGLHKMKKKMTITTGTANIEVTWTPRIRMLYIVHLIFKLALECTFLYLSYLLQHAQSKKSGFAAMWVPEKYECTHGATQENSACSQNPLIPCWVSRPWEKTIFMLYMTGVTIISVLLCLGEFVYVLTRTTRKGVARRAEKSFKQKSLIDPMLRPPSNGYMNGSMHGTIASSASSFNVQKGEKALYPFKDLKNGHANGVSYMKNGHGPNGVASNGHVQNGHAQNGHAPNGHVTKPYVPDHPPHYPENHSEETPLVYDRDGISPQSATAPSESKVAE